MPNYAKSLNRLSPASDREDGFTLVELLVVIVILGILIAIAVPAFLNQQDSAKQSEAQQMLNTAFKVAKAEMVSNGGVNEDDGKLANLIAASEPQMNVYLAKGNEAEAIADQGAVYVVPNGSCPCNVVILAVKATDSNGTIYWTSYSDGHQKTWTT